MRSKFQSQSTYQCRFDLDCKMHSQQPAQLTIYAFRLAFVIVDTAALSPILEYVAHSPEINPPQLSTKVKELAPLERRLDYE